MKITQDIEYAAKLITSIRASKSQVRLEEVSQANNISLHFLEQVARRLRIGGVIKSKRGPGGGYRMVKETISLADLIRLKHAASETTPLERAALEALERVII